MKSAAWCVFLVLSVGACGTSGETREESFFANAVPFRGGLPEARERVEDLDFAGAAEIAEAQVAAAPDDVAAWYSLGSARAAQRDFGAARKALSRAVQLDDTHAAAWNNLGLVLGELGKIDAADAAFRKAATLRAEDTAPWVNLAWLFTKRGLFGEAVQAYGEALFRDPQSAWIAVAHAGALVRVGRADEAVDTLNAAIVTYGESVEALATLSTALRVREHLAEAREAAERALALDGSDPQALVAFALALDALGDPGTEAAYTRALAVGDGAGKRGARLDAIFNYGSFLDDQKRVSDADAQFRQYIELSPGGPEVEWIRIRFQRQQEKKQ